MIKSKTCHGCGIEFKPNYPKQRYHNHSCWLISAENREKMFKLWRRPEFQALVSEVNRERWRNDPEFRAYISEVNRERLLKLWRDNSELRARLKPVK
jgi:hypothetical protein